MAVINGTPGNDVFANSPSGDTYYGGDGDDTLMFGSHSGEDSFFGGAGTNTLKVNVPLFNVTYAADVFIIYPPILHLDFDRGRFVGLSDGSRVGILNQLDSGWQKFQAADTVTLTHVYCGSGAVVTGTAANEILGGSFIGQTLHGGGGSDVIFANSGADIVFGDDGNDYISAGLDDGMNDVFDGGAGTDTVSYSGSGPVTIDLLAGVATGASIGSDTLIGFEVAVGSQSGDVIGGTNGNNTLYGLAGDDAILGLAGNDAEHGGAGKDQLYGGAGADRLDGGAGKDTLYGGGGKDVFDFNSVSDSRAGGALRDVIADFRHAFDKIDLKDIDANTGSGGNQAFAFIGSKGFHHVAGEQRFQYVGAKTVVSGDVNGNGTADFQAELTGHRTLTASDFIL